MKVAIVGGGPSGLYLALLIKKRIAESDVVVYEQNASDATFGFGVVIADSALNRLAEADLPSYEALTAAMHFNYAQDIVQRDTPICVERDGRGGAIARLKLLEILQEQCHAAGVTLRFGTPLQSTAELEHADVIVGADGVNSLVRREREIEFGTTRRFLTNHFAWYGTQRRFDNPALVFREFQGGSFVAHYYTYDDTMSTFVAECDDATWISCGLDSMSDDERQQLFERIFAPELGEMPLISNKSVWRQFPVLQNKHWRVGKRVLIGDALASAHFSIGSGTRIAMEDAIVLADALSAHPDNVSEALAIYEAQRGPEKAKLLDAAERSFDWYERFGEWMQKYQPIDFVYAFMTRTGRLGDERLRAQFPKFMEMFDEQRALQVAPADPPSPEVMDSTESVISRRPFIVRRRVRWGDCDPAGVVYTGRFPEYVLGAVSYFIDHIAGGSMHAVTKALGVALPCKGMKFEFVTSLWPNDVFDIHCEVSEIRSSSFDIACTAKKEDGTLVFRATFSPICIEIKNSVRARTPIPQEIRDAITRHKRFSENDQ